MARFSIVTCISNPKVYEDCLIRSVNRCRKSHNIEFIPIINDKGLYSASAALNMGLRVAKSDNIICAHQDISLYDDWFDIAEEFMSKCDNWGVIGSAGISLEFGRKDISAWGGSDSKIIAVGTVWDSSEAEKPFWDGIRAPTRVHAVDECLFMVNRKTGLRFDSGFNGFHFYGVDICLQARADGFHVYSGYLPVIHHGKFSTSMRRETVYWRFLRALYTKWGFRFPELLGTHFHWVRNQSLWSDELTSYIPFVLRSPDSMITIKAAGIKEHICWQQ